MIQSVLTILRQARERNCRAVLLVPEAEYPLTLKVLAGLYEQNAGRTARMPNGHLVTVLTPSASPDTVTEEFSLYLSGWGSATRAEEASLRAWSLKANAVYTEIS
jgi:hypothetical protein